MPSQQFPQSEKFNCVFQLIKHQHNKAFIFSFIHSHLPPYHLPPLICLFYHVYNLKRYSGLDKMAFRIITTFLLLTFSPSVIGLFKVQPQVWSFPSCRHRENLMVVYSGASAVPSHLFQSFRRRRGIYCNLRRIDSAYLFRLSLC